MPQNDQRLNIEVMEWAEYGLNGGTSHRQGIEWLRDVCGRERLR